MGGPVTGWCDSCGGGAHVAGERCPAGEPLPRQSPRKFSLPSAIRAPRAREKAITRIGSDLNPDGSSAKRRLSVGVRLVVDPDVEDSPGALRAVVSHASTFYSPAYTVAQSINEALDPAATPPRRFVRKKQAEPLLTCPPIEVNAAGDTVMRTARFRGWRVEDVINRGERGRDGTDGRAYVQALLAAVQGGERDVTIKVRRKCLLLLAAARINEVQR